MQSIFIQRLIMHQASHRPSPPARHTNTPARIHPPSPAHASTHLGAPDVCNSEEELEDAIAASYAC